MSKNIGSGTEAKQRSFSRFSGELPIYCLARGDHILYYAPGYLAAAAARHEAVLSSRLVSMSEDRYVQSTLLQTSLADNGCSSKHKERLTDIVRTLVDAARTAVSQRTSAVQSPFRPISLTLYLNHRCNLRCSYCYAAPQPWSQARLSIDNIRQAAQLVAENCAAAGKPLTLVCHGGGEPTLDQEYLERAVKAVESSAGRSGVPLFRYVATNGVLPASKALWLAQRFDLIGLSCDGPPQIQDRQRPTWGGGPTSRNVEDTAQILKREEADFQVRLTVTPSTVDALPQAAEYLCRRIQPNKIWVEPVYRGGRAQEGFSADDALHFVERFLTAREVALEHGIPLLTSGNRLDQVHGPYCSLLQGSLQLLPDGAASACFKTARSGENDWRHTLYSLREAPVFALDGARSRELQVKLGTTPAVCLECVNAYHCTFGCPDHCMLAGQPPVDSFRCRLGLQLTRRQLRARGDTLWTSAQLNGGLAATGIAAWNEGSD